MRSLFCLGLLLALGACGHKKVALDQSNSNVSNEVVSMTVLWLKDKGKKFDVEIQVQNKSNDDVIIKLGDMNCGKGAAGGQLKHTFFNTGERTIDFTPHQMKQFRLVCDIGQAVPGDFQITINRVFDNPQGDGATRGKQIGGKLQWKAAAAD
jgi:hypothetical protein